MCLILDNPGLLIEVLMPLSVGWREGEVRSPQVAHLVASFLFCLFVYFERQGSSFVVLADPKLPCLGIIVHSLCPGPRAQSPLSSFRVRIC